MFFVVLLLLFTANVVLATEVQCISDCTISDLVFGDTFSFPNAQCPQRVSTSECTIRVTFNYQEQRYTVELGKNRSNADFIYINSKPYLSYTINHYCSDQTECVFKDLQKKIDQMVRRTYNTQDIYGQLAPSIKDSSRNDPLQCYDMKNEVVECSEKEICGLSYDQQKNEFRARGCDVGSEARVFVYDADTYSALHIDCDRNLCNDEKTLADVKNILVKSGLIGPDGRRVLSNGMKQFLSFPLFALTLILSFQLM